MATRIGDAAESAFIYTREAHPGELHQHHRSFSDKLASAVALVQRFGVSRRVLVDTLDGAAHRAYGMLPNMTYILRQGGRVFYRASWTDPATVEPALRSLLAEMQERASGALPLPYFVEWEPARSRDRAAFLQGLLDTGGERAVQEYIDAARSAYGNGYAKPLQAWWDDKRGPGSLGQQ